METLFFDSANEWRSWLTKHGESQSEGWVGLFKKKSGKEGLTYEQAVEQALCFGWIDGLTKSIDELCYKIRFTPRRPRGNWSNSNVKRVEKLIKTGQMTAAGLTHVAAAKADGRWPS